MNINTEKQPVIKTFKKNILICSFDIPEGINTQISKNIKFRRTALQCLNIAVEESPDFILILFVKPVTDRIQNIIELCRLLKQNSRTRKCEIIISTNSKQRDIFERLLKAGADYYTYFMNDKLWTEISASSIVECLEKRDKLKNRVNEICPYLNHNKPDFYKNMALCGAYFNRMVLAEEKINTICTTHKHSSCEHFLKPRCRS
jgi:CheY-like chemotaxis protein